MGSPSFLLYRYVNGFCRGRAYVNVYWFAGLGKASPTMVPLIGVLIAGFGINDI